MVSWADDVNEETDEALPFELSICSAMSGRGSLVTNVLGSLMVILC